MKRITYALIPALSAGAVFAQAADVPKAEEPAYQTCLAENDGTKRLACFDMTLKYVKPAVQQPQPKPGISVLVRQTADFDTYDGQKLLTEPAKLMINRSDGEDTSTIKLGVIGAFRPINALGWQPYIAAAWNRDSTVEQPFDLRDVVVGITGPMWDPVDLDWTISPNLKVRHRADLYGTQDGNAIVTHFNLIVLPLVNSVPGKDKLSGTLVPYFGAQLENRNGGVDNGRWESGYLGAHLNLALNKFVPRLSLAVKIQRFSDMSAPGTVVHRSATYESAAISYAVIDPDDTSAKVRPALTLERNVGNDLLSGSGNLNKTAFGVTVTVN